MRSKFPRVVIQLDEDSLELSDECREDLSKVINLTTAKAFKDKYGRIEDCSYSVTSNVQYRPLFCNSG